MYSPSWSRPVQPDIDMPLTPAQSAIQTCQTLLSSLQVPSNQGKQQFQSVLHPEGCICHVRYRTGDGVFFHDFKKGFWEYIEKATAGKEVEELMDGAPTVLVDHDIAVVWGAYSVRIDGELSHVGTNCFNLAKICMKEGEVPEEDNWEWKIVALHDTTRKATKDEKERLDKEYENKTRGR